MDKRKAMLSQLKDLRGEMNSMMGDSYGKNLKKVTVASDSKEGLEEGLSKAQEIMKKKGVMQEMSDEEKMSGMEDLNDSEEAMLEGAMEDMVDSVNYSSADEIKEKIAKLQEKLSQME